jgi:glutaredoxin
VTVVVLYGKPGCHLCEDARAAVEAVRSEHPFALREVDVSTDPVLNRRYGALIPVVEIDGEEAFHYQVDPAELRERLDRVSS